MVTFLPQYLTEAARLRSQRRSEEKGRLEKLFPGHAEKVKASLAAWDKAHPTPRASLSDVADHIDHVRKIAGISYVGIGGTTKALMAHPMAWKMSHVTQHCWRNSCDAVTPAKTSKKWPA